MDIISKYRQRDEFLNKRIQSHKLFIGRDTLLLIKCRFNRVVNR